MLLSNVYSEIKKEYYKNGTLKQVTPYNKTKKNGKEKHYYKDGKLAAIVPYKNGEIVGTGITYYPNGNLQSETPVSKGEANGLAILYFPNGNIQREIPYENGKINGTAKTYFKDKTLRSVTTFKNDLQNGKYSHYYENGCKMSEGQSLKNRITGELKIYYPCNNSHRFNLNDMDSFNKYSNGGINYLITFKNGKAIKGVSFNENGGKSKMTNAHLHNMGFEF